MFILTPTAMLGMVLLVLSQLDMYSYRLDAETTTLFAGDSHIQTAVDDALVPQSKNVGRSSESLYFTYYTLIEYLRINPQVSRVYVGFGYHSLSEYYDEFISGARSSVISSRYFFVLPKEERAKCLQWNSDRIVPYVKNILHNGLRQHFTDASGFENEFINTGVRESSVIKRLKRQYLDGERLRGFSSMNLRSLELIADLCTRRGIELILVNTPVHSSYRDKIPEPFVDEYRRVIERLGLPVVSFENLDLEDEDFIPDGDHVSRSGAFRTTTRLAEREK